MLRRTEVGRRQRSGTVWRRRSLGSPAAEKIRYGGKYSRTHHLLKTGDSIHVLYHPLPLSVPGYRQAALGNVPRVIVTAHRS
jgi:hypothetical protein